MKKNMSLNLRRIFISLLTFGLLSTSAFAIDLASAKKQGLVGETPSGYLQAVGAASAEVTQLINRINGERKAVYQKIAKKNNTQLDKVEALAGNKAIGKSKPGEYVLLGGGWKQK